MADQATATQEVAHGATQTTPFDNLANGGSITPEQYKKYAVKLRLISTVANQFGSFMYELLNPEKFDLTHVKMAGKDGAVKNRLIADPKELGSQAGDVISAEIVFVQYTDKLGMDWLLPRIGKTTEDVQFENGTRKLAKKANVLERAGFKGAQRAILKELAKTSVASAFGLAPEPEEEEEGDDQE